MIVNEQRMVLNNSDVDVYGFERGEEIDKECYEAFMAHYLRVLAKRLSKWEKFVEGNNSNERNQKLKRYVRKGIPSSFRVQIWMSMSGGGINHKKQPNLYKDTLNGEELPQHVSNAIRLDIRRTFPENIYFRDIDDSLLTPLSNVLTAYAKCNPDVGYCQGMNYIAGMLLLITRNEDNAFCLLKQLLDHFVPGFHSLHMHGLKVECRTLEHLIKESQPVLYKHFKRHSIDMELFISKWFVCLYVDVLPVETVLRVWDCMFYEGSKILLRAAYTLIVMNRDRFLLANDFTKIIMVFKDIPLGETTLECHTFLKKCFSLPRNFSMKKIRQFRLLASESITRDQ